MQKVVVINRSSILEKIKVSAEFRAYGGVVIDSFECWEKEGFIGLSQYSEHSILIFSSVDDDQIFDFQTKLRLFFEEIHFIERNLVEPFRKIQLHRFFTSFARDEFEYAKSLDHKIAKILTSENGVSYLTDGWEIEVGDRVNLQGLFFMSKKLLFL